MSSVYLNQWYKITIFVLIYNETNKQNMIKPFMNLYFILPTVLLVSTQLQHEKIKIDTLILMHLTFRKKKSFYILAIFII